MLCLIFSTLWIKPLLLSGKLVVFKRWFWPEIKSSFELSWVLTRPYSSSTYSNLEKTAISRALIRALFWETLTSDWRTLGSQEFLIALSFSFDVLSRFWASLMLLFVIVILSFNSATELIWVGTSIFELGLFSTALSHLLKSTGWPLIETGMLAVKKSNCLLVVLWPSLL